MIQVSHPNGILHGSINVGGSKSMANRAILLADLYAKHSRIVGIPDANDTIVLKKALHQLNNASNNSPTEIDIEDAGTVCRFILPVLAFHKGEFIVKGSLRMNERPLIPLINVLRDIGARIDGNKLPLRVTGVVHRQKEDQIELRIDTSTSSQFASALLMILPLIANSAEITLVGSRLSLPYIDMTIHIMKTMGFDIERDGGFVRYKRGPKRTTAEIHIEPDYSSVAFWVGITALSKSGEVKINAGKYRDSIQGDKIVIDRAVRNGMINVRTEGDYLFMQRNRIERSLKHIRLDFTDNPDLAIPELIMYSARNCSCQFSGVSTLDLKESPRLTAMTDLLGMFGIELNKMEDDAYRTSGKFNFPKKCPVIHPKNDHRLAMGFAMTGIVQPIRISSPNVVSKSYPAFWDDLRKVNFDLTETT